MPAELNAVAETVYDFTRTHRHLEHVFPFITNYKAILNFKEKLSFISSKYTRNVPLTLEVSQVAEELSPLLSLILIQFLRDFSPTETESQVSWT